MELSHNELDPLRTQLLKLNLGVGAVPNRPYDSSTQNPLYFWMEGLKIN